MAAWSTPSSYELPGIDRKRRTELDRALALVDVAVERQRRAVGEDRLADGM